LASDLTNKVIQYLESQQLMGTTLYIDEIIAIPGIANVTIQENISTESVPIHENVDLTERNELIDNIIPDNGLWKQAQTLTEFHSLAKDCLKCGLGQTRKNFVFGSGNPKADIMIIGEAPGADEDEQGLPFVGRAGQLLSKIIESIDLTRDDVYICNIVKCRPPKNRAPVSDEVDSCLPYLLKQIDIIKPAYILALGATAVESLTNTKVRMADTRGKLLEFHGIKMLVTYHPAALLYNPNLKRDVWEDMKYLKKLLYEQLNDIADKN
jgi:DNA polymerase